MHKRLPKGQRRVRIPDTSQKESKVNTLLALKNTAELRRISRSEAETSANWSKASKKSPNLYNVPLPNENNKQKTVPPLILQNVKGVKLPSMRTHFRNHSQNYEFSLSQTNNSLNKFSLQNKDQSQN